MFGYWRYWTYPTLGLTGDIPCSSGGNDHLQGGQGVVSAGPLQAAQVQIGVDEVGQLYHDSGPVDRVQAHEAVGFDQFVVGEQTAYWIVNVV